MKKLWAMLMAVSMLLSLMGAVGVQAIGQNEKYPLLFETYETEESLTYATKSGGGNSTLTLSDGGANGSAGAAHVVHSGGGYTDIMYPTDGVNISKGQKVDISVWVKMNSKLREDVARANMVSIIFYGKGTVASVGNRTDVAVGDVYQNNGWLQKSILNKMVQGEWVHIQDTMVWNDTFSIGSGGTIDNVSVNSIAFRIADIDATGAVVDGAPLDYEFDDFIVRYTQETEEDNRILAKEDFDSSSVTAEGDGRSEDCSPAYRAVTYTADQVPEMYKVGGKETENLDGFVADKQANAQLNANLLPGHLYKISGWYRFDLDDTAEGYVSEKAQLRMIFMGKDRTDINFSGNVGYPSYYGAEFKEGEWTKIEYYFHMDYRMYATNPNGYLWMRICPYSSYNGRNTIKVTDHAIPGTYGFDNLVVEDLGTPANGNFEQLADLPVARNFMDYASIVPGWSNSGIDAEVAEENGNHFVKYTCTKETYGSMQASYQFLHGKTYRISFRAKTEGLPDGETLPLTMILDRKVETAGTSDSYTVPNYEYLIGDGQLGTAQIKDNHPWQLSNEWKSFSTTYTTNSKVIEGMEETAKTVNPRAAIVYFLMNGTSPAGSTLYLDDFVIEEVSDKPVASNISFVRNGNEIFVNYDCATAPSDPENKDATLIRAFLDNGDTETNIGTFSGNESFTVPAIAIGKTISFEVIPVSESGVIGKSATAVCDEIFDFLLTKKLNVNDDFTKASYEVKISSAQGADEYRAALAMYDGNSKLLGITYDVFSVSDGANSFEGSAAVPAKAEKIKLMVLDAATLAPKTEAEEVLLPKVNQDPFAGKDEVNVVFLGGSITEGAGASNRAETCYAALVGKYLKEAYEDKTVNVYNEGVGGTGSDYGLMRLSRDIIVHNPDVVFVEFAVNDGGLDKRVEMESIVRTLNSLDKKPYIVYLYTTRKDFVSGKAYHAQVADFYGIPQIDLLPDLKAAVDAAGGDTTIYLPDGTHPSDAGYQVYADKIIACLETGRFLQYPNVTDEKLMDMSGVADFETLPATEAEASGTWAEEKANLNRTCMISSTAGDTLTFEFTGNAFGVELILNDAGGKYDIYIDGEYFATRSCYYKGVNYNHCRYGGCNFLLDNDTHTVEIKVLGEKGDDAASGCRVGIANVFAGTIAR